MPPYMKYQVQHSSVTTSQVRCACCGERKRHPEATTRHATYARALLHTSSLMRSTKPYVWWAFLTHRVARCLCPCCVQPAMRLRLQQKSREPQAIKSLSRAKDRGTCAWHAWSHPPRAWTGGLARFVVQGSEAPRALPMYELLAVLVINSSGAEGRGFRNQKPKNKRTVEEEIRGWCLLASVIEWGNFIG